MMKKISVLALSLIAAVVLTSGVTAKEKPGRSDGKGPFADMDKDNNGNISEAEWTAAHKAIFAKMDKDSSGAISKEEMKAGQPEGGPDGRPDGKGPAADLDKDNDGKISAKEWSDNSAQFKKLDKNSDGYLTDDEMRPEGGKGRGPKPEGKADGKGPFAEMDKDNNGRISESEWTAAHKAMFTRMDKNSDGSLSEDEMRPGDGPKQKK
ncbi:MAG: EF-hand domain-containing protein [Spirochaetota bacterium]